MSITIDSTEVLEPREARAIGVEGHGARGGKVSYDVFYNRDGSVRYAFCHKGQLIGYLKSYQAPREIVEAAKYYRESL